MSVGGFRAVFEPGAGGEHSLCPEAFGVTLGTPLKANRQFGLVSSEFPWMCRPGSLGPSSAPSPASLGFFLGVWGHRHWVITWFLFSHCSCSLCWNHSSWKCVFKKIDELLVLLFQLLLLLFQAVLSLQTQMVIAALIYHVTSSFRAPENLFFVPLFHRLL